MLNILVIDTGTSSQRGVLFDKNGNSLFVYQINYSPEFFDDGRVEQCPDVWKRSLIEIVKRVVKFCESKNISIHGMSITSQRTSLIPVDEKGNYLSDAIMWQDLRTQDICKELESGNVDEIYKKTGMRVTPILSVTKSVWLRKNQPEIYNNAYKLLGVHEYIINILTNKFVTDQSIVSRSGLMNVENCTWDEDLIKYYNIAEEKLCTIYPPGAICGYVSKEFSKITGINSEIPIITAGGDQQCALLGLNAGNVGSVGINTGTGSYVVGCTDKYILNSKKTTAINVSAIEGRWIVESSLHTTGTIFRWFNKEFYREELRSENTYQKISEEIKSSGIGASGLIMLPYFKGSCVGEWDPNATGVFYNVKLNTTRGDFARGILEGIASEIKEGVKIIEEVIGDINKITISGGLTQLDEFNQIQADMIEKKLYKYNFHESTCLGAWFSAAKTLGIFKSINEAFKHVAKQDETKVYEPIESNTKIYANANLIRADLKNSLCNMSCRTK